MPTGWLFTLNLSFEIKSDPRPREKPDAGRRFQHLGQRRQQGAPPSPAASFTLRQVFTLCGNPTAPAAFIVRAADRLSGLFVSEAFDEVHLCCNRAVQPASCFRVRPHGFFADAAFGHEQSNSFPARNACGPTIHVKPRNIGNRHQCVAVIFD